MQPLFQLGQSVRHDSLLFGKETGRVINIIRAPEPYGILYDVKMDKPSLGQFNGQFQQFSESRLTAI